MTKQQRRLYGRIICGLERGKYLGETVYFLTLTSSLESETSEQKSHFNALMKRIERKYGYYEYLKLRTHEGKPQCVLHILLRGHYIDIEWLRKQWEELHSATQIRIIETYGKPQDIATYLGRNYLCKHNDIRMSTSKDWIYSGFSKISKEIYKLAWNKKLEFTRAIELVRKSIYHYPKPYKYRTIDTIYKKKTGKIGGKLKECRQLLTKELEWVRSTLNHYIQRDINPTLQKNYTKNLFSQENKILLLDGS